MNLGEIVILGNAKIMSSKMKSILIKNGFNSVEELNTLRIFEKNTNYLFEDTDFILLSCKIVDFLF